MHQLVLVALVVAALCPAALAVADGKHKSHECTQCPCFVVYPECDIWGIEPYKVASAPYGVTEDECVYACRNDRTCQAVVYGVVGGREWFTCEFYRRQDGIKPALDLGYVQPLNVYVKRVSMECMLPRNKDLEKVATTSSSKAIAKVEARKAKYAELAGRVNPLYGRRR